MWTDMMILHGFCVHRVLRLSEMIIWAMVIPWLRRKTGDILEMMVLSVSSMMSVKYKSNLKNVFRECLTIFSDTAWVLF